MIGTVQAYDPSRGILTILVEHLTPDISKRLTDANTLEFDLPKKKRSIDANAYMWVLITKMAEVLRTSKDEVYEECLRKYGLLSDISITVKAEVDMSRIAGHWMYLKDSADGKFKAYLMIRGTSDYDRAEMAHFLDMVIEDAKELGVETATPAELERMLAMIKERNNGKE